MELAEHFHIFTQLSIKADTQSSDRMRTVQKKAVVNFLKNYVLEKRILFEICFANPHISKPESHFSFIAVLSAHIRLGATLKSLVQLTNKRWIFCEQKRRLFLCPFHSSATKVDSIKYTLFDPYYGLTCGTEMVLSMIIVSLEARFWPILM